MVRILNSIPQREKSLKQLTWTSEVDTIGKNLGFNINETTMSFQWSPGKANTFTFGDDYCDFMETKAFRNGNIHCKMNQKFMKKLNVEAG